MRGKAPQGKDALAHEFISALVEGRPALPDAVDSANSTFVGLCAHQSALAGGQIVQLPAFTRGPVPR